MVGTSLDGVPHTFEFSETDGDHVCIVRVTMPDGSEQAFEATCPTNHAARLIAVFKASFAVKCARELADSLVPPEQGAPAPSERGAEVSGDSTPKSLDVESRISEPHNETSNIMADTHLDQYSSSAEDDDDEIRTRRRMRPAMHTPIAFIPAPDTPANVKAVESESNDDPRKDADGKTSPQRSSPSDTESLQEKEVLGVAPSRERTAESPEVEEGEEIEPVVKTKPKDRVERLTPRKGKYAPSVSNPASKPDASPRSGVVPTVPPQRKKRFRSEAVSATKRYRARSRPRLVLLETDPGPAAKKPKLQSSRGNGKNRKNGVGVTLGATAHQGTGRQENAQFREKKREVHNAEVPVTSGPCNEGSRIPRLQKQEARMNGPVVDMPPPNEYGYASMYQHQPPPLGPMHLASHPGQMHNSAQSFGGPHMFAGAPPHHMSYHPQYPPPPIPPHPAHMGAPYQPGPPPVAPFGTSPSGQAMASTYIPQQALGNPGFPPPMMAHAMGGGYPYQHPLPNGTVAFYHPHTQAAYQGPQLQETKKAQREAEITATAAEIAANMAAEAAAKDAARDAKSDFEAKQKKSKRACQTNGKNSGKPDEPSTPDTVDKPTKDSPAGSATAKQAAVRKPRCGENEVADDSKPAEDGNSTDYISILNRMAQKGKVCTNLSSPIFADVRGQNGSRSGQQCTMSIRFVSPAESEGILITKTVVASKKKNAKQLAVKELLEEIEKRMQSQIQSSEEDEGPKDKSAQAAAQKKNQGITTAKAALHRLYTLNTLCGPPVFKPEEPAGGDQRGLWKSVVVLDVRDFGKHTFEEVGMSKKVAKQTCAQKAFDALKEMNVPGIEMFTNIGKEKEKKDPDPENDKTIDEEDAIPIEAIVDMLDDDDESNSSVDAELTQVDDRLTLPKDYKLVFPETEGDCERWFKENGRAGNHFGLFVDSPRARDVFAKAPSQKHPEATKEAPHPQPQFLCISTATSGIVIRFPESATDGSNSEPPVNDNASLPEVVVDILEDPKTKKHGFAVDAGMSILEHEEDFQAQAVNDVAMTSLAIAGLETVKPGGHLESLRELTRHWLKSEPGKISTKGVWRDKSDVPTSLLANGGKEIIVGVLASYACYCIWQQMRQAAKQKRTRMHGIAAEFLELGEKLMSTAPA